MVGFYFKTVWSICIREFISKVDQNQRSWIDIFTCFRYSEIKGFDFEKMKGGGHFTQVVWKRSTRMGIGCACNKKSCFTVAQYFPAGNFDGIESYRNNVKKPLHWNVYVDLICAE